jgi:hypothetical protein
MRKTLLIVALFLVMVFGFETSANQKGSSLDEKLSAAAQQLSFEGKALKVIKRVPDGVVFFFENEDPAAASSGTPPPPPVRLAPITEMKQIDFETGSVTIPGNTVKNFLLVDVYLRQRYFYRNDGQNFFRAFTLPVIEIESVIFNNLNDPATGTPLNGKLRITLNGLHLDAGKTLVAGERGNDSRGNKDSFLFSSEFLDGNFGPGTAKEVFKNDLTIRMRVENRVQGLHDFVAGTFTKVFGD